MMKKLTRLVALIVLILISIPMSLVGTRAVQINKRALWIGGTQLRGANIYHRRVYPELDGPDFLGPGPVGPPYTQADFNRLAALGANYVNISHPDLFSKLTKVKESFKSPALLSRQFRRLTVQLGFNADGAQGRWIRDQDVL